MMLCIAPHYLFTVGNLYRVENGSPIDDNGSVRVGTTATSHNHIFRLISLQDYLDQI